jgi:hypothetical protein
LLVTEKVDGVLVDKGGFHSSVHEIEEKKISDHELHPGRIVGETTKVVVALDEHDAR